MFPWLSRFTPRPSPFLERSWVPFVGPPSLQRSVNWSQGMRSSLLTGRKWRLSNTALRTSGTAPLWRIRRAYCTTDEIPPENSAEVEGLLTQPRTARGESGSPGTSRRSSGAGLEDADAPLDGERNRRSSLTFKTLSLGSQKLHQLQRSRNVPFCKVKLDRTTCCCL
jgi:hypothetical protein